MTNKEMNALRWALGAPEDKVGPGCVNVPVPSDGVSYARGYQQAIADVRAFLDARVLEWWTEKQ